MARIPHLEFLSAVTGMPPHLFNANLRAFEGPLVHIGRTSGGGGAFAYIQKFALDYM